MDPNKKWLCPICGWLVSDHERIITGCPQCSMLIKESRPCEQCTQFKVANGTIPFCRKKLMGVTHDMHVTYRLGEETCFEPNDDYLYDADPDCEHNIVPASGGGVKCTKCNGWFCF